VVVHTDEIMSLVQSVPFPSDPSIPEQSAPQQREGTAGCLRPLVLETIFSRSENQHSPESSDDPEYVPGSRNLGRIALRTADNAVTEMPVQRANKGRTKDLLLGRVHLRGGRQPTSDTEPHGGRPV